MRTRPIFFGPIGTALVAVMLAAPIRAAAFQTNATEIGAPAAPWQAAGVTEVVKMFRGGISSEVMVSWINNSPLSFYLSADNIIALQQQGVPMPVVQAMIQRNGQLGRQATAQMAQAQVQKSATVPTQAPAPQYYSYSGDPSFDSALASRQVNSYNNYAFGPSVYAAPAPVYDYYDPYPWGWDGFYPGAIIIGGGYGFGHGYGGFRGGGGHGGFGGGGFHGGGGFGGGHGGGHR